MKQNDIDLIKTTVAWNRWDKANIKKIYGAMRKEDRTLPYQCFCDPEAREEFKNKTFPEWYRNNKHLFE